MAGRTEAGPTPAHSPPTGSPRSRSSTSKCAFSWLFTFLLHLVFRFRFGRRRGLRFRRSLGRAEWRAERKLGRRPLTRHRQDPRGRDHQHQNARFHGYLPSFFTWFSGFGLAVGAVFAFAGALAGQNGGQNGSWADARSLATDRIPAVAIINIKMRVFMVIYLPSSLCFQESVWQPARFSLSPEP